MVFGFLIATIILFALNIALNLIGFGSALANQDRSVVPLSISLILYLILMTWNIFAIVSF